MMRIISFDVGIKNMAYCLFEVLPGDEPLHILQWNILNLSGEEDTSIKQLCNCVYGVTKKLPGGKVCGKKAIYGPPPSGDSPSSLWCKKHAEIEKKYMLPKKETKLSELKKKKVEELTVEWGKLERTAANVSLRKQQLIDSLAKYYEEREYVLLSQPKKRKAGEINLIEIGENIQTQLDNYLGKMEIDYVIIENQISTIATRMKTIQGMLAQYFIMRENGEVRPKIEFISSHNKLKGFSLEHQVEPAGEHDKKKYKANKMNGVDICRRFLDSSINSCLGGPWKDYFERNGKKDDLADGFLQGIFYLKREKIINYAENLKINSV